MKKIIALILVALFAFTALVGCGEKEFSYTKSDLSEYVTLGKYIGVEIEVEDYALTDKDVEDGIAALLDSKTENIEIKDRVVADGDTVVIDYVGKRNGVAFSGGTATGAELVIGSNSYIDGFEDGLVGVMPGTTLDLNLTFPDPYQNNPDLAGADVVFTVTVQHIKGQKVPEWNDEFAKTVSEGKHTTADAYLEELKTTWAANKKIDIDNKKTQDAWTAVLNNCTIVTYPEGEVEKYRADIIASYEDYAKQMGTDLDTLLAYMGTDKAGLEAYADQYAHSIVAEELVFFSIVKAEGLEVGEEEYQAGLASYAEYYQMTVEELKKEINEEDIKNSILFDKMLVFITENAVIKAK